jgi:hypothetical protein
VNGGLVRSEGRRVKPSAGASSEGHVAKSASPLKNGRGPAQDPGWRESAIQRSRHRQKRWRGRGTGAVIATGSYEGSLPMVGIPDHHETSSFTSRRSRWSWLSRASSSPCSEAKSRRHGEIAALAKARGAEGDSRGSDRGVRGSIASAPWDQNAHAHDSTVRQGS